VPEYLPATNPLTLRTTVIESALTGQLPDTRTNITAGLLPYIDPFSLLDPPTAALNDPTARAASALTPSAFRSVATGDLHVYFVRNASEGSATVLGDTRPGQPFRLFRTQLDWNPTLGTWVAQDPGQPLAQGQEKTSTARWFSPPALVVPAPTAAAPGLQNTSPFVLHEVRRNASGVPTGEDAVLYWVNTESQAGAAPTSRVLYARIDPETGGLSPASALLADANPAVRRIGPRAVTMGGPGAGETQKNTLVVLYYGGATGRSSIFYATAGNNAGTPAGGASRFETALPISPSLNSATDPVGVARYLPDAPRTANNQSDWVLDVYYSGVSRVNQNADVYMTRYRLQGGGRNAQLVAMPLPRIGRLRTDPVPTGPSGEALKRAGREPIYASEHISWRRSPLQVAPSAANPSGINPELPIIDVVYNSAPAGIVRLSNWRYDEAAGVLFQTFQRTLPGGRVTLNVAYVDTSAGTVRFQGDGGPRGSDAVFANYTPQTYRTTQDATTDVGSIAFTDQSLLPATEDGGTGARAVFNSVLRRPNGDVPVDRQWLVWQKGARVDQPASLFASTRRVGIDLRAIGALGPRDSIRLTQPNGNGNQQVRIAITSSTGGAVPFDVDFRTGRVFFPGRFEGLRVGPAGATPPTDIQITLEAVTIDENGRQIASRTIPDTQIVGTLGLIEDRVSANQGAERGVLLSRAAVNEGSPFAFADAFDGRTLLTSDEERAIRQNDPTLQPGRVWLFWNSPRGRTFNLFWQTLAPKFESTSVSALP
jgi:hypothetical protein